jgi:16S rRNA (guanine1207-N2)-methyltransferase
VASRLRSPLAIVLGSPAGAADLAAAAGSADLVCYQMDLHQAGRLREELAARGVSGRVVTHPDLWDLPAEFQTVLFPAQKGVERELKIDMVEQAFHILRPGGTLLVLSEFDKDRLFAELLKKVFGRVHADTLGEISVFWGHREKERPRRRHELLFHARIGPGPSLRFLTRPGVFSYGRLDDGARALVEVAEVKPGDRVLDLGCGCGTNGTFAGLACAPGGHVVFVDSNVRALALAEHNARLNGVPSFSLVASATAKELEPASFDLAIANPPYYANLSIASGFVERSRRLLHRGGRFYAVSRQVEQMFSIVEAVFPGVQVFERRGYGVFFATVS